MCDLGVGITRDVKDESQKTQRERTCDRHKIVVVGIGHVKLTRGEFRVVSEIDAFVSENKVLEFYSRFPFIQAPFLAFLISSSDNDQPELSSDFVDSVDAANDEHLVVEFGSDSHVTIDVQLVVMRDERLGRGTA